MTSTSDFIAERLSEIEPEALVAVAIIADVELKIAKRAASGESISACAALSLIAARGYDPVTRKAIEPRRLRPFDHGFLAMGLKMRMQMNGHKDHPAAAAMKVSTRVIKAMREGNPVSVNNVTKACAYVGVHPFDQCVEAKVREAA